MKISAATDTPVETAGLSDSSSFSIKQSPKAFQILSSGLYSNKPLAIVRELSCNAYDAHVMVGRTSTPIEVKLPNKLDTQFYVKDFGPGLTHEQVLRLYTTYFDSTKTNSNDFIGGLGLGSKSPFSYTDSFTVESRQNGVVRTYGAYVNDDGIPTIALMSEQPTTEPDGLTVGFPVKPEDYHSFAYEARTFLLWMTPAPVLKGADLPEKPAPLVSCAGIAVYDTYPTAASNQYYKTSGTWVRMGQVNYPINWQAAGLDKEPLVEMLSRASRAYVLDAPIGSLNVAASREGLQYDKQGKREIADLLKAFAGNLIDYLNKEAVTARSTLSGFAAGAHIQKITSPWGFDIFDPKVLSTLESLSGKKLEGLRDILIAPLPAQPFKNFTLEYFMSTDVRSSSEDRHHLRAGNGKSIDHRYRTLVIENDTKGFLRAIAELRSGKMTEPYYGEPKMSSHGSVYSHYERTLVIVPNSSKVRETEAYKKELAEFLSALGDPVLRHTSEYVSPLKAPRVTTGGRGQAIDSILAYPITRTGFNSSSHAVTNQEDFIWMPVDIGSSALTIRGKRISIWKSREFFEQLHNTAYAFGIKLPKIVAVAKQYQRRVEGFTQASSFDAWLDQFFKEPAIVTALQNPLHIVMPEQSGHYSELVTTQQMLTSLNKTFVQTVPALRPLLDNTQKAATEEPLARCVLAVHALFGQGPAAKVKQLDHARTFNNFSEKFPLFSVLIDRRGNTLDSKVLRDDVKRYIKERGNNTFDLVWSDSELK